MKTYTLFFILLFFCLTVYAQDSLYLVGTITGKSTDEAITHVSGIGDVNGDGYDDFIVSHYFNKSAELYFGGAALMTLPFPALSLETDTLPKGKSFYTLEALKYPMSLSMNIMGHGLKMALGILIRWVI